MSQADTHPPALPPRKVSSAPIRALPEPRAISEDCPQMVAPLPTTNNPTPPPLPSRPPRQVAAVALAAPLELQSHAPRASPPTEEAPARVIPRPISVEVIPATPQILSPSTPPSSRPPVTAIPTSYLTTEGLPNSPLPEPLQTAPAVLSNSSPSVPPPLPRRPAQPATTPVSLTAVGVDALPLMTSGIAMTLAVAVLAYTRMLPLWLVLLGVGGVGYMIQPANPKVEDEETERALGRDRAEMSHAVGWV